MLRTSVIVLRMESESYVTYKSRSSRQWYVAPMSLAAAAPSPLRFAPISSGPNSVVPQSPGVEVTMCTSHPFCASSINVPAARNSQSSGCAIMHRATFRTGVDMEVFPHETYREQVEV